VIEEPSFSDATVILDTLIDIREDVEICRAILEDEFGEVEEEDS
jgi:hypothetical protein